MNDVASYAVHVYYLDFSHLFRINAYYLPLDSLNKYIVNQKKDQLNEPVLRR